MTVLRESSTNHNATSQEISTKHEKDLADMVQHVQDLSARHLENHGKLKLRMRLKVLELHKRELLHQRLKGQITVLQVCDVQLFGFLHQFIY